MSFPAQPTVMTSSFGGVPFNHPHWATMYEIQQRAQADAEIMSRRYILSPVPTSGLHYDDRLHVRLGCGKTKAYELLTAYTDGKDWGLRHQRVGNKYIVPEQAVREWFGCFGLLAA